MTNFEYIIAHLTERDIAMIITESTSLKWQDDTFIHKIYQAWEKWALSFSPNSGNMAKGCPVRKNEIIKNDPSIWFWEKWFMPDNSIANKGRTNTVSMQVWLSLQYNPENWK